jgi:hypothetical protein
MVDFCEAKRKVQLSIRSAYQELVANLLFFDICEGV